MDLQKIMYYVIILILPTVLTIIFSKLGIDRIKFQRYQRLIQIAQEAVLWADDTFPGNPGSEKLLKAIDYFRNAAIEAGFWIADEDAEKKVRVAYQAIRKAFPTDALKN